MKKFFGILIMIFALSMMGCAITLFEVTTKVDKCNLKAQLLKPEINSNMSCYASFVYNEYDAEKLIFKRKGKARISCEVVYKVLKGKTCLIKKEVRNY